MGWICPNRNCLFSNVWEKKHCHNCGTPRPAASEPSVQAEGVERKESDELGQ